MSIDFIKIDLGLKTQFSSLGDILEVVSSLILTLSKTLIQNMANQLQQPCIIIVPGNMLATNTDIEQGNETSETMEQIQNILKLASETCYTGNISSTIKNTSSSKIIAPAPITSCNAPVLLPALLEAAPKASLGHPIKEASNNAAIVSPQQQHIPGSSKIFNMTRPYSAVTDNREKAAAEPTIIDLTSDSFIQVYFGYTLK